MARSIEISTAHNIVVYFDLASLTDRIVAVLLDLVFVTVFAGVFWGILSGLGIPIVGGAIAAVIVGAYHLIFEIWNGGQSLGKKVLNIKVVNLKGVPPSPAEAFQRWVFRMIDVTFTLGALASLFITSSPKNQRIGDIISGCTVIKLKKSNDISLDRIQEIQDQKRQITYPGVVKFTDKDMLLVKEILVRHKKFKNRSTREAAIKMTIKLSQALDLSDQKVNQIQFLENVLKDYVSLTR